MWYCSEKFDFLQEPHFISVFSIEVKSLSISDGNFLIYSVHIESIDPFISKFSFDPFSVTSSFNWLRK